MQRCAMKNNNQMPLQILFPQNRFYQFWLFQLLGWSGLSIISFFSLNLWYDQPQWIYLGHNAFQSVLGMVLTWPLRNAFRALWHYPIWQRASLGFAAVLVVSAVWAVVRLEVFMLMTGEKGLWRDFGGWLFSSIFIFLCWSALYHSIKYNRLLQEEHASLLRITAEKHRADMELAKAENVARNAQLQMLRYQLNPHFLFNTLNAISALVQMGEPQKSNTMILQLSHFLRYSLAQDPNAQVSLEAELKALNSYLEIEKTRFAERLQVTIDIDPEVQQASVPSLLIQPLIENAIKYGISGSEDGGTIRISAAKDGQLLRLLVEDSGSGAELNLDRIDDSDGVGLSNTRERLKNYYGGDQQLQLFRSALGGVGVDVSFPFDDYLPQSQAS